MYNVVILAGFEEKKITTYLAAVIIILCIVSISNRRPNRPQSVIDQRFQNATSIKFHNMLSGKL